MSQQTLKTAYCNLNDADYRAFRRHVLFRYRKIHWLYGAMLTLLLLLTWSGGKPEESFKERVFALVGVVIVFVGLAIAFLLVLRLLSRFNRFRFSGTVGEHIFEFTEDGLCETNVNGKIETKVKAIRCIDETPHHFFIITTTGMGHVIPKRDFQNTDELRVLQAKVTGHSA
jgi:hypothetical protein